MKKIELSNLSQLFAKLSASQQLYIPAEDGMGQARFLPYSEGMELTNRLNTLRSAKDLFFPQIENIYKLKIDGKQVEIIDERDPVNPFIIFGVRACDYRSFDILDRVFIYAEPTDTYYKNRRDNSTIITMACGAPEETCFCTALGINPADPAGDVTAWQADGYLYLRANTEKGEALVEGLGLEDADDAAVEAKKAEISAIAEKLPLGNLKLDSFNKETMLEKFNDPRWAELSESCLGCGTCTFVCPTCQCYDVREFNNGREVQRFRCWDSCMYSDFTQMSAGQPRPTQKERFRQRFMHKLVYYPNNNEGIFGCVGCGRCLQKCPIHMNIVKVAKTIGGESNA